jgi:hypothetical protein
MMTETTTTTKRRTQRASEEARGTLATGGVPTVLPGGPMGQRCLSALRALTLQRVQRSCGGFSEDDISWQMRTMLGIGEVLEELEAAGLIRCMGNDDEDEVACYALPVGHQVRGIAAEATRYGAEALVALEVVGVPVARENPDVDQWLWERYMRLQDAADLAKSVGQWGVFVALGRRSRGVLRRICERQRRFLEGYARTGVGPGWTCRSVVLVEGRPGR